MPVSVEFGGIGDAVMMATPADLEDYAVGFALGEGLVERAAEVERIDVHRIEGGVALRLWLTTTRNAIALDRARRRVGESRCGLCGLENLEEDLRPLPRVHGTPADRQNRTSPCWRRGGRQRVNMG